MAQIGNLNSLHFLNDSYTIQLKCFGVGESGVRICWACQQRRGRIRRRRSIEWPHCCLREEEADETIRNIRGMPSSSWHPCKLPGYILFYLLGMWIECACVCVCAPASYIYTAECWIFASVAESKSLPAQGRPIDNSYTSQEQNGGNKILTIRHENCIFEWAVRGGRIGRKRINVFWRTIRRRRCKPRGMARVHAIHIRETTRRDIYIILAISKELLHS